MTWALAGQVATVWLIVAAIAAPLIGRWLRARRARNEFRSHLDREARTKLPSDPGERRAVVQSDSRWTESEYQKNARVAESLGFVEPEDAA